MNKRSEMYGIVGIVHNKYNKRLAYSRFSFSFEYVRCRKTSLFLVFLIFNWYTLGRILSIIINQIVSLKKSRWSILKGYIIGYVKAISNTKNIIKIKNNLE